MGRDTQISALTPERNQHELSQLTHGAWNNSHHMLPLFKLAVRVMRTVCIYAGLKRYEKGTVGIVWNREKTEVSKKGKGELRLLWLRDFVKRP